MPGAILLNDVAADERGTIYVSDTLAARVYRLKNHKVDVYLEEVPSANGLWQNRIDSWWAPLHNLLPTTLAKTKQLGADFPFEIDGITPFKCNSYLVSSWGANMVCL